MPFFGNVYTAYYSPYDAYLQRKEHAIRHHDNPRGHEPVKPAKSKDAFYGVSFGHARSIDHNGGRFSGKRSEPSSAHRGDTSPTFGPDGHRRNADDDKADELIAGHLRMSANAQTWIKLAIQSIRKGEFDVAIARLQQAQTAQRCASGMPNTAQQRYHRILVQIAKELVQEGHGHDGTIMVFVNALVEADRS